jgi:hypothetical protein
VDLKTRARRVFSPLFIPSQELNPYRTRRYAMPLRIVNLLAKKLQFVTPISLCASLLKGSS